jgi:hypothetical protein
MTHNPSLLHCLETSGLSTCIDSGGGLRVCPTEKLTDDLRHYIRENKTAILASLWETRNSHLLAGLPETSSGSDMSAERYLTLRSYIASS